MLHTPGAHAAKFWPGELGVYSNHACVCARLVIDGQDYGVQFFFVPIREPGTHKAYPGVEVGDIGTKIGYATKDNGFLLFNHYRIPRTNLVTLAL